MLKCKKKIHIEIPGDISCDMDLLMYENPSTTEPYVIQDMLTNNEPQYDSVNQLWFKEPEELMNKYTTEQLSKALAIGAAFSFENSADATVFCAMGIDSILTKKCEELNIQSRNSAFGNDEFSKEFNKHIAFGRAIAEGAGFKDVNDTYGNYEFMTAFMVDNKDKLILPDTSDFSVTIEDIKE